MVIFQNFHIKNGNFFNFCKAHGFAMHSMSLWDMQISKSEKKILSPPLPNSGDASGSSTADEQSPYN